jgi:hypothetical protein
MSEPSNSKEFMFILRGGVNPRELSPDRMQYLLSKFQEWMGKMAGQGQLKGAGRLEDAGKCITGEKTPVVTDGPFAESKEIVGGYFLVLAPNLDAAVEIAKGCPLLENKGRVEVRPLQPSPGN